MAGALHFGAEHLIATDISPAALELARQLGVHDTVQVGVQDLPEDIEVVLEASGAPAALGPVLRSTARGGVLVQVGNLPAAPVNATLGDLVTREITWIGSFRFVDEMTEAVQLLAAGLNVGPVITHEFPLSEALQAFDTAADPTAGASKVMIRFNA